MAHKAKKEPMIRRNVSMPGDVYLAALTKAQESFRELSPIIVRLLEMWANDEIALTPRPKQEAEK